MSEEIDWAKRTREDMSAIRRFSDESGIRMHEILRLAKKMCSCGTCHYFEQHYDRDGAGLDWGHCWRGNIQHSKRQSSASCGMWEDYEKDEEER